MKIHLAIRSKWLVKFHPSIEANDAAFYYNIRLACRNWIFRHPETGNAYDMRNILEGHVRDRINA